jgi:hypothetical protein
MVSVENSFIGKNFLVKNLSWIDKDPHPIVSKGRVGSRAELTRVTKSLNVFYNFYKFHYASARDPPPLIIFELAPESLSSVVPQSYF